MFEIPEIPNLHSPPWPSAVAFYCVVFFVVWCVGLGIWKTTSVTNPGSKKRVTIAIAIGLLVWLSMGAILPLSGILRIRMLPPPGLIFAIGFFAAGVTFTLFSKSGRRLSELPIVWLIGFQIFRVPLELILHYWYSVGTLPVQMTYAGYNFDIVTGLLAIAICVWARFGNPTRAAFWAFNTVGMLLLVSVVIIAVLSTPVFFRQFMNEPAVLLPFYFPYSYIVSVAVTGALMGHLVLFRKLLTENPSK